MRFVISFSWVGLTAFLLPMLINVVFFVFQPVDEPKVFSNPAMRVLEIIENVSRSAYAFIVVFFVSESFTENGIWLYVATVFLVVYYIVWARYFFGNGKSELLQKSFLLFPIPLAIFPVIYYFGVAIWLNNYLAAFFMIVFGFAHVSVSARSFR